jgi:hypothetical protein
LQAEQAGRAAGRAASKMSKAGQSGEQGEGEAAEQAATEAQKDLDDAQEQLADRRRQAEVDLALEQLAKIEDAIKSLHQRQQEVIGETERLEKIRQDAGRWTRGQAQSVRDLARQQETIKDESDSLAKKLTAAEVFSLALRGAGREMSRAVELLDQRETGKPTVTAENNALRRFAALLEALKLDKAEPGENQQGGEGQGGQKGPPRDGITSVAQLKMLKLMQQEINERTKALAERFDQTQKLTPEEMQEFEALSQDQASLADLALNLSKPDEKPANDPGELPELKLDNKEERKP